MVTTGLDPALSASITLSTSGNEPYDVVSFAQAKVSRRLRPEEIAMLKQLSPQGIAKLNHDVCAGVPLDQTLAEFGVVFKTMALHREAVLDDTSARRLLKLIPPTSGDLGCSSSRKTLLKQISCAQASFLERSASKTMLRRIEKQVRKGGDTFCDALEEFVFSVVDSEQLSTLRSLMGDLRHPVYYITLAPTTWVRPLHHTNSPGPCLNHTLAVESHRIVVGLNAVTNWFVESSLFGEGTANGNLLAMDSSPVDHSEHSSNSAAPAVNQDCSGSSSGASGCYSIPSPAHGPSTLPLSCSVRSLQHPPAGAVSVVSVQTANPPQVSPLVSALKKGIGESQRGLTCSIRSLEIEGKQRRGVSFSPAVMNQADEEVCSACSKRSHGLTWESIKAFFSFWKRGPVRSSSPAHRKYLLPKLSAEAAGLIL